MTRSDKGEKHDYPPTRKPYRVRGPYRTGRRFDTGGLKTTTKEGKRIYMRQYMKAKRDKARVREYAPRQREEDLYPTVPRKPRPPKHVSCEEILRFINENGCVATSAEIKEAFTKAPPYLILDRLKELRAVGELKKVNLHRGMGPGHLKFTSYQLFNDISNKYIVYSDEDKLVEFLAQKLDLHPNLPTGFRSALTRHLRRLLPKRIFKKLYKFYERPENTPGFKKEYIRDYQRRRLQIPRSRWGKKGPRPKK